MTDTFCLLEEEMRVVLRHMAAALIHDPVELQRRYDEIDAIIAKLSEPEGDDERPV